jgi:DNA-binding GntR family transcriptional regulator
MEVTTRIRDSILAGDLVPNQRLVQIDLADQFGVPRATIRESLAELVKEGLVEWLPNKGARVRVVSLDEAIEISELRMVIESFLAGRAAERATDDDIATLRALADEMRDAVAAGDLMGYSRGNQRLHAYIQQLSAQATASRMIDGLRSQNVRRQFRLAMKPGRASVSLPEHLEIIDAICARDPERAERAMREHMASVITALREQEALRQQEADL